MLGYTFYEIDNRVMRYAETLVRRGDEVDVFALRVAGEKYYGRLNGVNIYRIQERKLNEKGKLDYLLRVLKFLLVSFWQLTVAHLRQHYDLIHVHSLPDFEVFAALVPKLTGSKVILDIHDIVPEFYLNKFKATNDSFIHRILVFVEKVSVAFSDHVIISNHFWEERLKARSNTRNKISTIMNFPDTKIFHRKERKRTDDKIIMLYPGSLNWHQGLDLAIKAFALVAGKVKNAELWIYGEGPSQGFLKKLVRDLKLGERVMINNYLPIKKIADIMANADIGIIPKRNDGFGGEAFSTKTLEFMCMGVPIIVSRTKIDQHYFNNSIVKFFIPENEKDLAEAMLLIAKDKEMRQRLSKNAARFVLENNWDVKKNIYLGLVDSLCMK